MEIISKKTITAPKVLIYGGAGVGKSTLAAQMPKPLFLDLEDGLKYMDVARTPLITTADAFYSYLLELIKSEELKKEYKTIVIDSLDWLVAKLSAKIARVGFDANGVPTRSMVELDKTLSNNLMDANGGFGKAKEELENNIRVKLIPLLAKLNQAGYAIVMIAHPYNNQILDDDGATMEKIMPKIDPPTIGKKPVAAPAFIEWVDNLFYLKKVNGERILQVESDNYAVAKNRMGLEKTEYSLESVKLTELLGLEETKAKKEDKE